MRKETLLVGMLACALSLPLVGCGGVPSDGVEKNGGGSPAEQTSDADAESMYWGQWHGYIETKGETVYGVEGGQEPMLDVYLNEDGSCSVEPVEQHADLLTDSGTWEASEGEVTMHLSDRDIAMTIDGDTATANAADFGISDFETINFDFYG